jgi:hypothetical protein
LAAGGWRKEETPEGLTFWVNDVTGETSEKEPAHVKVVLVSRRTLGGGSSGADSGGGGNQEGRADTVREPVGGGTAGAKAAVGAATVPPPPPAPPGVGKQAASVMLQLATRVSTHGGGQLRSVENGEKFEALLKRKNQGDPTFSFLFHVGSVGNVYYETLKRYCREASGAPPPRKKRRREWGPPADGGAGAAAPADAAAAPAPPPPASTIAWEGVTLGDDGWVQHTLVDGRTFYRRSQGAFVETSWDRPTLQNTTQVKKDASAAEPVVSAPTDAASAHAAVPAVGPIRGTVVRKAQPRRGIAEALLAAKERARLQRQDEASSSAVGGSDSAATSSGSSYRAAQRIRRGCGPKHYSNSALGVGTQPTISATAAQKNAASSSVHDGDDESARSGEGDGDGYDVDGEGVACRVLCAMPDGSGLWCRARALPGPKTGGVLVRVTTPVCAEYRRREHVLPPTALRPDFQVRMFQPATSHTCVGV